MLGLTTMALMVIFNAVAVGFKYFKPDQAYLAEPTLRIMTLILATVFMVLMGLLFHVRGDETLKLWSATSDDLQGFGTLDERDEDLFD